MVNAEETAKLEQESHDQALAAAAELYRSAVAKDSSLVESANGALSGFRSIAPEDKVDNTTLADLLIGFGSLLGMLSEQPEVIFQMVDAMTVLSNGERILFGAAGKLIADAEDAAKATPAE